MGSSFKGKDIIFYYGIRFFFFWSVLSLPCCAGFSLVVASGGYPVVAVCRLLIAEASLVWHMGSRHTGLEVVASGL